MELQEVYAPEDRRVLVLSATGEPEVAPLDRYGRLGDAVPVLGAAMRCQKGAQHCDDDRRGTFAQLTDEGFAVLAAAAPGHATAVHDLMFEPLGDEGAATFGDLVHRVLHRLTQQRT